jgi:hypothetical protein
MKKLLPLLALFAFTAAVPATSPLTAPVDYRFDDVRRTVTLAKAGDASSQQKSAATKGQRAQSGDKVHTGWFSYALISSEKHRAKFEIFSSSDVELAGNEPGVILSLERGKLHAMFDKITGTEPRVVKTPGALLAVRGTQYVAEVNAAGETVVDVYEGTVEVRSPLAIAPMLVHAGESSTFSRRRAPDNAPTPRDRQRPEDRDAKGDNRRDPSHDGPQPPQHPGDSGHRGPDDGGMGGPGRGPGPQPGGPQPQPPRPRP